MGKVLIGIDLGTTNSCVSVIEGNQPTVIANNEGKRTTPSIVSFMDNGEKKIGDPAKRQMVTNKNTIYSVKRIIGKKYDDVKNIKLPYDIVEGQNGMAVIKIGDRNYTPQEISAMILQKMKKTAEDYLGTEVKDAVITVPAYFNDSERQATKEAGEIAGLNVLRIINEPTAASLAYGLDKIKEDKKVAVFDVGGGTYDISILELGDGVFEVKSTNGDVNLGGDNWDDVIIDYLAEEFQKDNGVDLRKDPMAYQRLKEAAEKAKIELSSATTTEINLPYIIPIDGIPKHLVLNLTRAKFEQLSDKLLQKLKEPCLKAIKDSGFNTTDIDEILLVGGSTRIPSVVQIAKEIFGKEPSKVLNPDESVAIGAAIQGGVLTGTIDDVLLLDVIPISLGIETMGNVMTKLIDANTTIPVSKSQVFSTASDNQPSVEIHILQGERPLAKDNKTLGRFHLDGILPAQRGVPQIEVSLSINSNGILEVSATDKGTGKKQSIRVEGSSNLSDEEIERMKREAQENEASDKKAKEEIDILNNADSMIFQTEKQIKEFGEKITESEKTELDELVKNLKESHSNKNFDKIKEDTEKITAKWNLISVRIYQETSSEQQTPKSETDSSDENTVTDTDFEDVK
jgi:molecular chaperone DnaK